MAIKLITNYCKRLGLPGYSSHQFSVSVETELTTISDIPAEAERLYHLLQSNVDQQMQKPGFVPPGTYGMEPATNGNNRQAQADQPQVNGVNGHAGPLDGRWKCSDRQRDLILKLVDEHQLDKSRVETLAIERFGQGVRHLDKLAASGLINELLTVHDQNDSNVNGSPRANSTRRVNGSAYSPNRRKDAA